MPPEGPAARGGGPGPLKRATEDPDGNLERPVGIAEQAVRLRLTKAHRPVALQDRPAGVGQHAARQRRTHGPLAAEEEASLDGRRVVQAIVSEEEGAGQGADCPEMLPVACAPRQAGDGQAQDPTDLAQADFGNAALTARAVGRRSPRMAPILLAHQAPFGAPAEGDGALPPRLGARRAPPESASSGEPDHRIGGARFVQAGGRARGGPVARS
jgi:hypothetical protein